ncbi:MAG TPA: hypothetical protein VMK31_05480 [Sphingomicrobium sp.]|nr:hypothetical protein [Sphingomicrobium sp.]
MRRATLLLLFLAAACGGERTAPEPRKAAVQTAELTGLYEGPRTGSEQSRLCMIAQPSGSISFGIVAWGPDGGVCSGAGKAVRKGDRVELAMAGDEPCVIAATAEATRLTLPESVPDGCAYYCSPGSSFAGATFEKTGGTAKDALRAPDLVGDPLCG